MRLKTIICKDEKMSPTFKKMEKEGEDCVVYRDGDSEFCWIVLVKENVVIESVSHYLTGEEWRRFDLGRFIEGLEEDEKDE